MSNTDTKIQPALTPGEWAGRDAPPHNPGPSIARPGEGYIPTAAHGAGISQHDGTPYVWDQSQSVDVPADIRHAVAALTLHGQPFGFTWADVDLLRNRMTPPTPRDLALGELADRIAALLPPRE